MTRREQADNLLLQALSNMEQDPHGQVSLLRSLTLATIANAMLQQEILDSTVELDLEQDDEDPRGDTPPW